ncbi:MAG: glycosyltransferase [Clostridia bacterium]|nr:glycosyltransferase [Clostridia bacterium]
MKKKILFLIPNLKHGGAEKVLVNLVNNLSQDKYDVTVQTLFDVGVHRGALRPHVRYIGGWKRQPRGMTVLMKLFSPKFLYKRVVKEKYDVVISYLEGPTARVVAGCPDKEIKKVCVLHTQFITDEVAKIGFRSMKEGAKCYASFDEIVACGKTVKEGFEQKFASKQEVKILYNVNETEQIVEKAKEEPKDVDFQGVNFCSAGKLIPVKAFDRLVRIHKRLLEDGYPHNVYIMGVGEEQAKLESLIKELSVEATFHLLGFKDNPYAYVSRCDAYVCSSLREGFSTATTEALVLGVPVVTTECSGMKEQLGDNDEYGIVTENSEEALYEGVKKLLANPELMAHYKQQAQERGKKFCRVETVRAFEEFVDNL